MTFLEKLELFNQLLVTKPAEFCCFVHSIDAIVYTCLDSSITTHQDVENYLSYLEAEFRTNTSFVEKFIAYSNILRNYQHDLAFIEFLSLDLKLLHFLISQCNNHQDIELLVKILYNVYLITK